MSVRFGEFVFDGERREITRRGLPVRLAPKAFDLLQLLIEERPRAVRKEELRERLWPDVVVDEANLKNLVGEIRTALGAVNIIRTVHRFGYAFNDAINETNARLIREDRTYSLNSGDNVIGRDDDCAVVLDFASVSRHHAVIRIEGDRYALEDLGSKNGTWKNDQRVKGTVDLTDHDNVRVGAVRLIFRSSSRRVTTATIAE